VKVVGLSFCRSWLDFNICRAKLNQGTLIEVEGSVRRHDTQYIKSQHYDIQNIDTRHKDLICDTQPKWRSA
jgi:hypothetical protein